jgi:hypothetical protein
MTYSAKRFLIAATVAASLAVAAPAVAEGPVVLTVTGAVDNANRGALDPDYDKLLAFNNVEFDRAMAFDLDMLQALPQVEVTTDFPKGGPQVTFTGPALADVLSAAGATGETVMIQAMDGYAVEVPTEEMLGAGAVLALSRDGKPLGIGDFGPTQVVFPRSERDDLADMPDDWWIWQIYHVSVE